MVDAECECVEDFRAAGHSSQKFASLKIALARLVAARSLSRTIPRSVHDHPRADP